MSGLVLAITFFAIYRQLALARGANAFDQASKITDEWESERSTRHQLAILEALRSGVSYEAIPAGATSYISSFWERWSALVRAGHVDTKIIHDYFGPSIRYWHVILDPSTRRYRADNRIRVMEHFDWLANTMHAMDRKEGRVTVVDDAYIKSTLDGRIERLRDFIRIEEELRSDAARPREHRRESKTRGD